MDAFLVPLPATTSGSAPENKSVLFFICPRLCCMQYPGCENPSIYVTSGRNQSQPKFHNVNCRFCGAIHNVDRACISVLSQVIRNVNERKTVQTNIISFVSHGTGILKICEPLLHKFLLRSPAECPANRNMIFRLYDFSF